MDIEHIVDYVSQNMLYCFINDMFSDEEIPYNESLLRHQKSEAYISKTGKVVALQIKKKRKTGFFIPCSVWGHKGVPDKQFIENHAFICDLFKYEALTPSSLSEKVLRATLPEKLFIYRPTDMIRRTFLANSHGGRIDEGKEAKRFKRVYSYDLNKAYLYFSLLVPSPFLRPDRLYYGAAGQQDERWREYPTVWMECVLIAHLSTGRIHPIMIEEEDVMREPVEGEEIHVWLWKEELEHCLEVGYSLLHVEEGYGFREMSNFMEGWADILWKSLDRCENAEQREMIKKMMVGLPGRFLKNPMKYSLIHESEYQEHDEPILRNWLPGTRITTPWFIRSAPDLESAQLTPIGHYIIMKCRQDMARRMRAEEAAGNSILSSYIDCYVARDPSKLPDRQGKGLGEFKQKVIDQEVVIAGNKIITKDIADMRAPGVQKENEDGSINRRRKELWNKYHDNVSEKSI